MPEFKDFVMLFGNLAGLAMMAWAIFVLHRDSINKFTEQLNKDRESGLRQMDSSRDANLKMWQTYMDLKLRQHEQLVTMLIAQDKTLDRVEGGQQRVIDALYTGHRTGAPLLSPEQKA